MKLVRFAHAGRTRVGVAMGSRIAAVEIPEGACVLDLWDALMDAPARFWTLLGESETLAADEVELLCPIRPNRVLATGINYPSHSAEMGVAAPAEPSLFFKLPPSVTGPGDVPLPADSTAIDYEGEVAVVIGRPACRIAASEAITYLAGSMLANDISARDLPLAQTILAKGSPGFCPLGPVLVTPDEAPVDRIGFEVLVNGEPRQQGNTAELLHPVDEIVASAAAALPLARGDVILTGTPGGVGVGRSPAAFLRPGDEVAVRSPQLGTLRTRLVAEAAR